jgi:hypothetical protein
MPGCADRFDQESYYEKHLALYIQCMVKYEIPTIFIDFNKMINSPQYLYEKLKIILDEKNISLEMFNKAYIDSEKILAPPPCKIIQKQSH